MKKAFTKFSNKSKKNILTIKEYLTDFNVNSITAKAIGLLCLSLFVIGCQKTEELNSAPKITFLQIFDVDQNTKIGDVIGNISAKDNENDQLSYQLLQGKNLFSLDENKIKTKVLFGQELLHKEHPITIVVTDGEFSDERSTTVKEIGRNGTPETVQYPDIVVQRNIHSGNYTFNPTFLRDGVPTVTKTEIADNDPNNATYQYDILNGQNGVDRKDLAKVEAEVNKMSATTGDATPLNLAPAIVDGYGIAGFRETTKEEREANNGSVLVNENGELISGIGFKKVVEFYRKKFGLTGSVDFKTPPRGNRKRQNARACVVMLAVFMTQTGADEAETVQKWGAEAYQIVTSKTDAELEAFMRNFASESFFINGHW